jgi:mannose-6-phosphate isomerase-like protein (cupin superfamily)
LKTRSIVAAALAGAIAIGISGCRSEDAQDEQANASAAPENAAATGAAASASPLVRTARSGALQWGPCPEIFPQGCELTILNGDPAQPNADALLRVPGGYAIPAHSHSSAERMILVEGVMEVQYQGHPAAILREGNYAYGPAGLPHRAQCRSSEPCVLFIAFVDPVDAKPFEGEI